MAARREYYEKKCFCPHCNIPLTIETFIRHEHEYTVYSCNKCHYGKQIKEREDD